MTSPRRGRIIVAMRTLLIVTSLLFACVAGATEIDAVAMVERLGGTVEGSPVTKVDLHESAVTDDHLGILAAAFPELRHLDLRKTKVTDAGVAHLKALKNLQFLNLFRTPLTDAGLASIRELTQLETLLIGGTKVTSEGLAALESFGALRKLSVFDTAVDDDAIAHLSGLASLRVLLIGRSSITPEGAKRLQAGNPELKFTEM
jgi:hypothetical protein